MALFTDKPDKKLPFRELAEPLLPERAEDLEVLQFCEDGGGGLRRYHVYKLTTGGKSYVLKHSNQREIDLYEKFLEGHGFRAPRFLGKTEGKKAPWILLEYIEGPDLRDFTPALARACAESILPILNAYWQKDEAEFVSHKADDRFEAYWERINRRAQCLKGESALQRAYDAFLNRQLTCPRTLCNGDFLQYNGLVREGEVYLIDWGFGGIMPYALDIARLIAHGGEGETPFPFYMDDACRETYVRAVYEGLLEKPDWERYCRDIQLALLNEYVEFLEEYLLHPEEERDGTFFYYMAKAEEAAAQINGGKFFYLLA